MFYLFQDGVWIRGLFLEGAGWDKKNACLIEAEPMQLVSSMPTIHFKPVENKKKSGKGLYCLLFEFLKKGRHQRKLDSWFKQTLMQMSRLFKKAI